MTAGMGFFIGIIIMCALVWIGSETEFPDGK